MAVGLRSISAHVSPSLLLAPLISVAAVMIVPARAAAQTVASPAPVEALPLLIQTADQALAQDATEYSRLHDVDAGEALRRLRAQEGSVAETERIRSEFRERLAGIAIEHAPEFRIVILLTGNEPVAPRVSNAGGSQVPIVFQTGAQATHEQLVTALKTHQLTISAAVPGARGMGIDGRTGKLVLLVRSDVAAAAEIPAAEAMLEGLTGVPSQIRAADDEQRNLAIEGGGRVEGIDPRDGRRYACTTGFVVAAGAQTGILTAAHCPDQLDYIGPDGKRLPLTYVGAWGARHQDVQLHASSAPVAPLFLVDRRTGVSRPLTGQRPRESTRAGEAICRRGDSSGYSCSTVDLIDFAPPGDLCAGPCEPVWVTVTGPSCRGGDSGGPVFTGTTAFGIVKGGSYDRTGRCSFYFYMSTDYLPDGWSLLFQQDVRPQPAPAIPPSAIPTDSIVQ